MMGQLEGGQDKFFYDFRLDDHVPSDHLLRRIDAVCSISTGSSTVNTRTPSRRTVTLL